jgi:acyl carrier protein
MEIENKIRQFIIKNLYYAEDNPIGDEDSFLETGVVDSMGVMELVAFVQSEFGIEVAQHEIVVENFDSIRKLANFVQKKLLLKAPRLPIAEDARLVGAPSLASQ